MNCENVVFVEDDPDDVFLLQTACRKAGVVEPVRFLTNGKRAVEFLAPTFLNRASSSGPRLIFLDLNMPEMNGFEFLDWLRKEARISTVPVVILSTSENPRDITRAYDSGANAYLVKASSLGELTKMISSALQFWASYNRTI